MNMKNSPTVEELAQIIGAADDSAGYHILWVSKIGEVRLTLLPARMSAGTWEEQNNSLVQFRSESYCPTAGYVGVTAADDPKYVQQLFEWLLFHWSEGSIGMMDYTG